MSKMYFAVSVEETPMLEALLRGITEACGKVKRGTAPRSGDERELQELVDQLAKIVGDSGVRV